MKNKYLNLKEIQFELKEILKELIQVLDKEKIEYFAWAGTFLGAVRHEGFIPWDDDIDIAMTRDQYNNLLIFLKENNNKINDNLEAIGYELGNSDFPFIKIINKKIRIENSEDCDKYLWIDIFPLDGVPNKPEKYFKKIFRLNALFTLKRQQKKHQELMASNKIKRFFKTIIMGILKIWKYDSFLKYFYNFCTKYDYEKSNYIKNNVWSNSDVAYKKDMFKTKKYKFEDLIINGLSNTDYFLGRGYGMDYMSLPPENKRVTHNFKAWRVK